MQCNYPLNNNDGRIVSGTSWYKQAIDYFIHSVRLHCNLQIWYTKLYLQAGFLLSKLLYFELSLHVRTLANDFPCHLNCSESSRCYIDHCEKMCYRITI